MMRTLAVACLVLAAGIPALAVDDEIARGRSARISESWAACAAAFARARTSEPANAYAWASEAYCRWKLDDRESAIDGFRTALELEPGYPDALYFLAVDESERGDTVRALELVESIGRPSARLAGAVERLTGLLLVRTNGDPARAGRLLSAAPLRGPAERAALALAMLRAGDLAGAVPLLETVCPTGSDDTAAIAAGWSDCIDSDSCGVGTSERLEILRQLVARVDGANRDRLLAETARVHLRHGSCPPELGRWLGGVGDRRPDACRVPILLGLVERCAQDAGSGCEAFSRAAACLDRGDSGWPELDGPVVDPATGAWLRLDRAQRLVAHLSASCDRPVHDVP